MRRRQEEKGKEETEAEKSEPKTEADERKRKQRGSEREAEAAIGRESGSPEKVGRETGRQG